jgi:hypothetical protein
VSVMVRLGEEEERWEREAKVVVEVEVKSEE